MAIGNDTGKTDARARIGGLSDRAFEVATLARMAHGQIRDGLLPDAIRGSSIEKSSLDVMNLVAVAERLAYQLGQDIGDLRFPCAPARDA